MAPSNNAFASATVLDMTTGPDGGVTAQTNTGATLEAGEPTTALGWGASASVWYQFVAPVSGHVTFLLKSTTFDAFLEVVSATSAASYSVLASVEANGNTQGVAATVVKGQTYYARVTGYNGGTGTFDLLWTTNDDLANAAALTTVSGSRTGEMAFATNETSEPLVTGWDGKGIWFKVTTGAAGGAAQFDTIGTNALPGGDSLVAVYTATDPANPTMATLTQVAADDQSGGGVDAKVTPTLAANTTYFVKVVPVYNGNRGRYKFNWSLPSVTAPAGGGATKRMRTRGLRRGLRVR